MEQRHEIHVIGAGLGGLTAFVWVYLSPVRTLHYMPEPAAD